MRPLFKRNKTISDTELIRQYQSTEDINLLGQLYSRYMDLIFGVCLKYFKNKDDAQDAVINIFEKIVVSLKSSKVDNFRPWLYVVAKNYCLMELRKAKHKEISIDDDHIFIPEIMESQFEIHPIDKDENIQHEDALRKCVEKLKFQQKESIELFYFKEMSYQQISLKMNIDIKKVKSYIQNAKRNLKICLENNHAE